jgi:hypothetical protein
MTVKKINCKAINGNVALKSKRPPAPSFIDAKCPKDKINIFIGICCRTGSINLDKI